jgi:carbonic anhydrase/acetyltransferase-like protein (isoleucine patch superfamily)
MMGRKYKLLKGELITDPCVLSRELKVYRIKALRDIPAHKVRKGDIGGYVTDKMTLSHQGECWIADNAIVHGAAVSGDALVSGNAIIYAGDETTSETNKRLSSIIANEWRGKYSTARITVEDEVVITKNAKVTAFEASASYINPVKIRGNAYIGGFARLQSPALVEKDAAIYGNTRIGIRARILDSAVICDISVIGQEVTIGGTTRIGGWATVGSNSMVFGNLNLAGHVKIADHTKIINEENLLLAGDILIEPGNKKLNAQTTTGNAEQDAIQRLVEQARKHPTMQKAITAPKKRGSVIAKTIVQEVNLSKMKKYRELLQETLDSLNSYETDIVKIIKYPVMIDRTDDYTASMLSAKRAVSLVDPETEESDFYAAVLNFDRAFHTAEANALKVATSLLNSEDQKKTKKAQDLFSIAVDTASTENEKVNAFKQGFKQLEGIILVPEQAVTALRVKAGIAEIEV